MKTCSLPSKGAKSNRKTLVTDTKEMISSIRNITIFTLKVFFILNLFIRRN